MRILLETVPLNEITIEEAANCCNAGAECEMDADKKNCLIYLKEKPAHHSRLIKGLGNLFNKIIAQIEGKVNV